MATVTLVLGVLIGCTLTVAVLAIRDGRRQALEQSLPPARDNLPPASTLADLENRELEECLSLPDYVRPYDWRREGL